MKPIQFYKQRTPTECFSACLATILSLPQEDVPDFTTKANDGTFWGASEAWLNERGWHLMSVGCDKLPCWIRTHYIMIGDSPRNPNGSHAVLYFDDAMVHDPHPDNTGIRKARRALFIIPFIPQTQPT